MEREWYYDQTAQVLIYKPNSTDSSAVDANTGAPTGDFVATTADVKVLFNISGSQAHPVQHVRIEGVTLRDTAYTYMDPHGLPSGGDWGLQKQGAITIVGSE